MRQEAGISWEDQLGDCALAGPSERLRQEDC